MLAVAASRKQVRGLTTLDRMRYCSYVQFLALGKRVAVISGLLLLSCGGETSGGRKDASDDAARLDAGVGAGREAGAPCVRDSVCPSPLACIAGGCRAACETDRDCPLPERCVVTPEGNYCVRVTETRCTYNSDCPAPRVCGPDGQCRNQCLADRDCAAWERCDGGLCQ